MPFSSDQFAQASEAANYIRSRAGITPVLGIVLGSGLGGFAEHVEGATVVPYAEIPNFPRATVAGHSGRLVVGRVAGVTVAVMQGRVHLYEGYRISEVTFPARVLGLLGVRTLIVTNAAGAVRPEIAPGSLATITDHINLTGTNAAMGPNEPRFSVLPGRGQRFFDMSDAYSARLRGIAHEEAARLGIALQEGVYIAVLGPSFETPAEIRAFRVLGADLVGMSTVHEVIAARHMGIEVLGLSLVTNLAAGVVARGGDAAEAIEHEDVLEIGRHVETSFAALLTAVVARTAGEAS